MQAILGQKIEQTQKFLENGERVPVTRIRVSGNTVITVKTQDKHGYNAMQLGFGTRKRANKALIGHSKGAKLTTAPQFLKEVKLLDGESAMDVGAVVKATEVFVPGDIIDVIGVSKGKGFAGGVKRYHFKGGPRTHGQSDRERAPGSIGQTTTPGRVYKGKRMAGKMGHETVTIRNLVVVGVTDDEVLVKGLVPGHVNALVTIEKVGAGGKFVPLYGDRDEKVEKARLQSPYSEARGGQVNEVEKVEEVKQEETNAS